METINLIKIADAAGEKWISVNKEDLVRTLENDSLQIISDDMISKYNIKSGDDISKLRELEDFEDDLRDCEYVETFTENWINLDSLKDNEIYIDNYSNNLFDKDDIDCWEEDKGYLYHDGSNFIMIIFEDMKEFEADDINREPYETGTVITYRLKNGKEFKIDDSMYQGTLLEVEQKYNDIIEDI